MPLYTFKVDHWQEGEKFYVKAEIQPPSEDYPPIIREFDTEEAQLDSLARLQEISTSTPH